MTKKNWNTPTLTTYGSVEQLTEQVTINKVPGSGDTVTLTVAGIGTVSTTSNSGSLESVTITP